MQRSSLSRHCFIKLSMEVTCLLWLTWLETERPLMAFIWRRPCHLSHSCLPDINRCFLDILLMASLKRAARARRAAVVFFFLKMYTQLMKMNSLAHHRLVFPPSWCSSRGSGRFFFLTDGFRWPATNEMYCQFIRKKASKMTNFNYVWYIFFNCFIAAKCPNNPIFWIAVWFELKCNSNCCSTFSHYSIFFADCTTNLYCNPSMTYFILFNFIVDLLFNENCTKSTSVSNTENKHQDQTSCNWATNKKLKGKKVNSR